MPTLLGNPSINNIKVVVDVIKAFNEDVFLNQELKRIWFNEDELFLKLNSFQFDIRFGDNNKMNKKLEMLKGFCIYNLENKGNETYKQIDLVYDNQLIAIKK